MTAFYTPNQYRYKLEKYQGKKHICPHCGRKSFMRYYDITTNEIVHEHCGRCDHESSCGFHYTPKQFFADNPMERAERKYTSTCVYKPQPLPDAVNFGDVSVWDSRLRGYDHYQSDFAVGLGYYFDTEIVHNLVDAYRLQANGEKKNAMFPNIDQHGVVQDIAVIGYGADLHRNGIGYYYRGNDKWKAKMEAEHPNGCKYGFCYFGEHLLPQFPTAPVALVESQKSAVICSAIYPEFVWLATCGSNRYKPEYCKPLKGRKVVVYPDKGCETKWQMVTDGLVSDGYDITLNPIMQQAEGYGDNSDIADYLLDELKKRELPVSYEKLTFEYFKRQPHVASLISAFDLVLA